VNIAKALEPFYTTKPESERSGMGFTVMQSFMDTFKVEQNKDGGISVYLSKAFNSASISNLVKEG